MIKNLVLVVCLFASTAGMVRAEPVAVYLIDNRELNVEILSVNSRAVRWQSPDGTSISDLPLDRIASIDFVPTEEWEEAEEALAQSRYSDAGRLYSVIANNKDANFYPAPGNFASLAMRRILECHRRLLNAKQVTEMAKQIEPIIKSLPRDEQKFSAEENAWIEAGKAKWEEVLKIAEASPASVELSYLTGVAKRFLGNPEEALDRFSEAYTLGFGTHPGIARASLKAAAEILVTLDDEERLPELQAQLKIYQDLYGRGKLWKDAPENFVKLAKADLNTLDMDGGGDEEPGEIRVPPLPQNLPPPGDRDWLLAIETDPPAYVYGEGPFEGADGSSPTKDGTNLTFSGKQFLKRDKVKINYNYFQIRAVFVPAKADGLIFNTGKTGPGCTLYIQGNQLFFAWKDKPGDKYKKFALGATKIGSQTSVVLSLTRDGTIKGRVAPGEMKDLGKVSSPLKVTKAAAMVIAPLGKENNTLGLDLPRFEGIIQHFSTGFSIINGRFALDEKKLFKGKTVKLTAPAPK